MTIAIVSVVDDDDDAMDAMDAADDENIDAEHSVGGPNVAFNCYCYYYCYWCQVTILHFQ